MAPIFENKKIESKDLGNKLKFPGDAILSNLPPDYRNLSHGQSRWLEVKDDQGCTHRLKIIKNQSDEVCFTDGWMKFIKVKGITVDDKISLYEEYDRFGSGGAYCIIKVKKA